MRILIAEDNPICSCLTVHLVRKHGHFAWAVSNGLAALAALEKASFDLVLMDVQMPEMDGGATTCAIRKQEQVTGKHLPIVAVTAHTSDEGRQKCLAAGVDDYLCKPLRSKDFLAVTQRLCPIPEEEPKAAPLHTLTGKLRNGIREP
ncbi:MAG TPA: response regulator [Candidatus Angelobacter sp.]|nr:response regulator [Candidatus Angelobacter sp.]